MSYLSEVLNHRLTISQGLAKSFSWVARQAGAVVSDDDIARAILARQKVRDSLERTRRLTFGCLVSV